MSDKWWSLIGDICHSLIGPLMSSLTQTRLLVSSLTRARLLVSSFTRARLLVSLAVAVYFKSLQKLQETTNW